MRGLSRPVGRFLLACVVLTLAERFVSAQALTNPDFEQGLVGWTAAGDAFGGQPTAADALGIDVIRPVSLGGDYWHDVSYPLGQHGRYLVRSSERGIGTLTSELFALRSNDVYLGVLVGGARNPSQARLELQVASSDETSLQGVKRDGSYIVVWHTTGRGPEQLQQEIYEVPAAFRGRTARIKIIDDSPDDGARISVDAITLSSEPPRRDRVRVWGIGDYHTHPMNHMAFGGLNGIRTVWGVPGGALRDYEMIPDLIGRDMPPCIAGHRGGRSAEVFIDSAEGRLVPAGNPFQKLWALLRHGRGHGHSGAPDFDDFPTFISGLHHQMHVTQIRRAWAGGLRLMTAIAVHNRGVEFVMSPLVHGQTNPSTERAVVDAQVCGMRQLAELNHDWMEIAYSPDQAREIISYGKLAVVLGIEMDRLGQLDGFDTLEEEVQFLWDLGIRQVTPIHAVDNRLGSAAVFQPVYNSLNDLLNRREFNVRIEDLDNSPRFFEVRDGGCEAEALRGQFGECVMYRLSPTQQRGAIMKPIFAWPHRAPFLADVKAPYHNVDGMMNVHGLTTAGISYLRNLMSRGMLVGLEHMSQHSIEDTYGVLGQELEARGRSECAAIGRRDVPESCFTDAYPLVVSHAHFRRLSIQRRDKNSIEGYLPSEYEVSDRLLEMLRRTGGLAGQFVAEDPVELPREAGQTPFDNNCAGSSKSFATSLGYALQRMNGVGVGLATDFTIIEGTAPRFGKHACWGGRPNIAHDGRPSPVPHQYERAMQTDGVLYQSQRAADGVRVGTNLPLQPYRMGKRVYDYNVDGLANYGLVPDFLQDLKNIGLPSDAFRSLFSSAEHFIQTWEKAERLSGVTSDGFVPKPLPCERACRGLCPASPNAGAPSGRR